MESSLLSDEDISLTYHWPEGRSFGLNLLLTDNGTSTGEDGTSHSLTSAEDRRILRLIRSDADVVIVGAESVRSEGWFLPPHGRLAVLSATGNIPWESCPDSSRVNVYPTVSAIVHSLAQQEQKILCEGGLTTAGLVAHQIGFDQIALTRVGEAGLAAVPQELDPDHACKLINTLTDAKNDMTFQYWRRAVVPQ